VVVVALDEDACDCPALASVTKSVFPPVEDEQQFPSESITMVPMGRSAVTKTSFCDLKKPRNTCVTSEGLIGDAPIFVTV
jgi:hypothetical protein